MQPFAALVASTMKFLCLCQTMQHELSSYSPFVQIGFC
jgi:hypothetical protein